MRTDIPSTPAYLLISLKSGTVQLNIHSGNITDCLCLTVLAAVPLVCLSMGVFSNIVVPLGSMSMQ